MAELDLDPAGAKLGVLVFADHAIALDGHAPLTRADDTAFGHGGPVPVLMTSGLLVQGGDDKPPDRTPPVPRLGQRPVDARRGHLKGVRLLAHLSGAVELDR